MLSRCGSFFVFLGKTCVLRWIFLEAVSVVGRIEKLLKNKGE